MGKLKLSFQCVFSCVSYEHTVLHPDAVISHLDSRALMEVCLSTDNCQISVSARN